MDGQVLLRSKSVGGLRTQDLSRRFGNTVAVNKLNLVARPGKVMGLLGPNGSGKTTTVRMLSTIIRPTEGTASVCGFDLMREPVRVRENIAVVSQGSDLNESLTVRENCYVYLLIRGFSPREANHSTSQVLDEFGLGEFSNRRPRSLSGGERRRVQVARVLASRAPAVFLDEPGTGLDPLIKERMWTSIRHAAREGRTVILTTQVLEEAEQVCDDVTFLSAGEVILRGGLDRVKAVAGSSTIKISLADELPPDTIEALAAAIGIYGVRHDHRTLFIETSDPTHVVPEILSALAAYGAKLGELSIAPPTLSQVYKKLFGGETTNA